MLKKNFLLTLSSLLVVLGGCSNNPVPLRPAVPVEDRSVSTDSSSVGSKPVPSERDEPGKEPKFNSPETADKPLSKTVVALVENVDKEQQAGDLAAAVAHLERAIRLEPKNARLWHRLAQLKFQQKNWQQAISMAKKSNFLAPGIISLQVDNWLLISEANARAGNHDAAILAQKKAQSLQ